MSIAEKIKLSIERATGRPFIYDTIEGLNVEIGKRQTARVVWTPLIEAGTLRDENGMYHEVVNVSLFFCDKMAGHDCFTMENEVVLTGCKRDAFAWLTALRRDDFLQLVSLNDTARSYEELDDVITAYALNVTIYEKEGFGACDVPVRK